MSLKQTISRAINGPQTDTDVDADAALNAVRDAQRRCDDLAGQFTALLNEQDDLETKLGRASDDQAGKLATKVREIEDRRRILSARQKAAGADLQEAKVALHKIGVAGQLKTAKRNTQALEKNAEEMNGHLEGLAQAFKRHFELAEKIRLSLPVEVNGGMMLVPREFMDALALELWRVLPVHPLMKNEHPPLPGAMPPLNADPSKAKPLLDAVREAMAYIVRKVEAGPVSQEPEPKAEQTKPANDPDDVLLTTTQPSGPTVSAEHVMATVGRRKLSVGG